MAAGQARSDSHDLQPGKQLCPCRKQKPFHADPGRWPPRRLRPHPSAEWQLGHSVGRALLAVRTLAKTSCLFSDINPLSDLNLDRWPVYFGESP